jgi:hypothetical protein
VSALRDALAACASVVPEEFRTSCGRLFEPDLLDRLADRLLRLYREGIPPQPPLPHFPAERTPPSAKAFAPFAEALRVWESGGPEPIRALAGALTDAGCAGLLVILGQRWTPASLTDARALPPPRATLLAAADRAYRLRDALSAAARALAKHVHRSPDRFWGRAVGSTALQNRAARAVVERILDGATWWNFFVHPQHGTVYEARLPSGHGARWSADGTQFIGFLEPFDPGWPGNENETGGG